ncbi:hypothetical protein [Dolichospermum flos-aquae]|uniref:Uncharacterized protein n=1 Tax=Dolichospermum flos-aquae CCAP 1403/13F TaxID=315271 RepID=A0A6H2BTE5_DOLFA|nr:hypothetical protein [Dolichospermum flos-aquae]QJB42862.1 hypothetical protein HGD76_20425 [Dolichospermum flos-aquae CCAP 1403/13F]
MANTSYCQSYTQITITISYVFSIVYHINIYGILLLMPASSVAIALAFRKNRSLGKTFWFTDYQLPITHYPLPITHYQ